MFLVRKIRGLDRGQLYAMKVLKKATLKGKPWRLKLGKKKINPWFCWTGPKKKFVFQGKKTYWNKNLIPVQAVKIMTSIVSWWCSSVLEHPVLFSQRWARGRTGLSQLSPWPTFVGIWCKWGYFVLLIQIAWFIYLFTFLFFIYFLSKGIIVNEDVRLDKVEMPRADLQSQWYQP